MDKEWSSEKDGVPQMRESAAYAGAFFPGSQHLSVTGGSFTSHVNIRPPRSARFKKSTGFRTIPRGDITLQQEICLASGDSELGVVSRSPVRRVFLAKVQGQESSMSVMLYQGEGASEECRKYIERHACLWHPNIVQIFAVSSFLDTHAVIAQDDLLPYLDFLDRYRNSAIMQVYFYACWRADALELDRYRHAMSMSDSLQDTRWIRRATGRLCIDLEPAEIDEPDVHIPDDHVLFTPGTAGIMHLDGDSYALESRAAHSLTIQAFHAICFFLLSRPHIITPVDAEVHLGSVFRRVWHSDRETWLYTEISRLPSAHFHARNLWRHGFTGETLPSGILRFQVNLRPDTSILLRASSTPLMYPAWLSQAQYIFQRLDITSDYDQYVCAECLQLSVDIPAAANRDGAYLFVCPPLDLSAAPISDLRRLFSWYWSLDPDGTNSFTEEEASEQGFPAVSLELRLFGCSWDEGVYAGLGKFHAAKGFDVESQDIALRLGYPLYEPLGNADEVRISTISPVDETTSFHDSAGKLEITRTWRLVDAVKIMLILSLSFVSLYEWFR